MSDFHNDYKRQLLAAADTLFNTPATLPQRLGRRVPLLAVIVLAGLLVAAAALAATGIIGVGVPVAANHENARPPARTGVGLPVSGAVSGHRSVQLLPVTVPDPDGGLPWGMRIVHTTRGLVCVQIGRLLDGRLGVLGQDGAFRDDGLFHELPAGVLDPGTCSQPGYYVLYRSEGLPSSAAMPGPVRSCLYPGAPRLRRSDPQACPAGDERMVAFGVLGPHARSVVYKEHGAARTVATAGPLGAYLVVLRQPPIHPRPLDLGPGRHLSTAMQLYGYPSLGSTSSPLGRFPIETQSSVISSARFSFGRRYCQSGSEAAAKAPSACTRAITHTPTFLPLVPRRLHSSINVTSHRRTDGHTLDLTFIAPAAVFDASTAYGVEITMPSGGACAPRSISGQPIERDVARGQVVHVREFVAERPGCHGVLHGRVIFGRQPDASTGPAPGETIGSFSFNLP
jgi:hypothetical protein